MKKCDQAEQNEINEKRNANQMQINAYQYFNLISQSHFKSTLKSDTGKYGMEYKAD